MTILFVFIISYGKNMIGKEFLYFFDCEKNVMLNIRNINGNIIINGWDSLKIKIKGTKKVYVGVEEEEKINKIFDDIKIDIKKENNILRVETKPLKKFWKNGWKVCYEIFLPFDAKVKINSVNGDVKIKNVKDKIDIKIVNGDIELNSLGNEISAETVNGNILLYLEKIEDKINISTVNGKIESDFPMQTYKENKIKLKTINGNIKVKKIKKE